MYHSEMSFGGVPWRPVTMAFTVMGVVTLPIRAAAIVVVAPDAS